MGQLYWPGYWSLRGEWPIVVAAAAADAASAAAAADSKVIKPASLLAASMHAVPYVISTQYRMYAPQSN